MKEEFKLLLLNASQSSPMGYFEFRVLKQVIYKRHPEIVDGFKEHVEKWNKINLHLFRNTLYHGKQDAIL